jgi:hypothetical protein
MNFDSFSNTTALFAHLPHVGMFIFLTPLLFLVFMRLLLALRTGSAKKTPAQWIASGEYDENGLPRLARAHAASDAARFRAAMDAARQRHSR